jgi:hypothetical protein
VTTFDRPLVLTFHPTPDDLAALLADLSAPPVSVLDPDSGEFRSLPTTWNADGTLMVSLDRLVALGPVEATAAPPEAEVDSAVAADPAEFDVAEPADTQALTQDET